MHLHHAHPCVTCGTGVAPGPRGSVSPLAARAHPDAVLLLLPHVLLRPLRNLVLGVPFYVMDYVEGRVLTDERLPEQLPEERAAIWSNAAQVLATLHSVDFRKVHLERHGKLGGGGYAYRQLDVWARQFRAVDGFVRRETPDDAELHAASDAMLELEAWLRGALRSFVSEEEPTCIVHGDFRLAAG